MTPAGDSSSRTVLVVGATRGIGLALAEEYLSHGWRVIATTVEPSPALAALAARYPGAAAIEPLDITDGGGGARLAQTLAVQSLDALHIVAGVFQRTLDPIWSQAPEEILRVLQTNAIGGVRLAEALDARVPAGGVFAFTSSGMGSLARNDRGDVDLYRVSKVALNMLVRSFAARRAGSGRRVLLLCPGWAKTDMGGPDATVEVRDSARGLYALVASAQATSGDAAEFREYTGDVIPW